MRSLLSYSKKRNKKLLADNSYRIEISEAASPESGRRSSFQGSTYITHTPDPKVVLHELQQRGLDAVYLDMMHEELE